MADQRTLELLIRSLADTKGFDEVKGKLGELEGTVKTTVGGFEQLTSLIGIGLGVTAVGAVSAATQELAVQAPLAAATSVSSYGTAAIAATVAIGIIGAIIAALTLHEGGRVRRRRMHGGGLADDEVPIIAQEGEIMIQRSVAQQPGNKIDLGM